MIDRNEGSGSPAIPSFPSFDYTTTAAIVHSSCTEIILLRQKNSRASEL
ncbi:hypothetical protein RMSM_01768 [Rhodopirellula maiorica SM1]|uniref:Uncharacterized protein n=1 Tax=Rhodopirellula maiorica SM1 TaxID=1265738 RepID=M5RPP0_9BACT|nr:hypothetical protein RMSM_01768 [Rhodopirellula maiorica SM1]